MNRGRFRFSLASLLLVTTVIALFLGYAQWRKTLLLRQSRLFAAQGVSLHWQDTWANWIWPVVAKEAAFEFNELPNGRTEIASVVSETGEANAYYASVAERLRMLGVEEVRLIKNGRQTNTFVSTQTGK